MQRQFPRTVSKGGGGERGAAGSRGPQGNSGNDGVNGASSGEWKLVSTITADGQVKANSLTPAGWAPGSLYLTQKDRRGGNRYKWFSKWPLSVANGQRVQIISKTNPQNFGIYDIGTLSGVMGPPVTTWAFGNMTYIVGNGTFTIGEVIVISASLNGARGMTGPIGPIGARGPQGVAGTAGGGGSTGPTGLRGTQGVKGDPGIQGIQGTVGPTGPGTITAGPWKSLCYYSPGNNSGDKDRISHIPNTEFNVSNGDITVEYGNLNLSAGLTGNGVNVGIPGRRQGQITRFAGTAPAVTSTGGVVMNHLQASPWRDGHFGNSERMILPPTKWVTGGPSNSGGPFETSKISMYTFAPNTAPTLFQTLYRPPIRPFTYPYWYMCIVIPNGYKLKSDGHWRVNTVTDDRPNFNGRVGYIQFSVYGSYLSTKTTNTDKNISSGCSEMILIGGKTVGNDRDNTNNSFDAPGMSMGISYGQGYNYIVIATKLPCVLSSSNEGFAEAFIDIERY